MTPSPDPAAAGNDLPHPTAIARPAGEVNAAFVRVTADALPDRKWHFELGLPRDTKLAPSSGLVPIAGGELVSLALFHRDDPACDIEVYGQLLDREIDAADWLDWWLAQMGVRVVSRHPMYAIGGMIGDVVGEWDADGQSFAGRFFATKWGTRLVLVWSRATRADYPRIAEDLFVTLTTFRLTDDSAGLLAERVNTISHALPVPFKIVIPESWDVQPDPAPPHVAAFQATLRPPRGMAQDVMLGKLSAAVVARAAVRDAAEALGNTLAALRDIGIDVADAPHHEELNLPPAEGSWGLVTHATVQGTPLEVRCRAVLFPQAWVIAAVLGPGRDQVPLAWMQNKRTLDIVTRLVRFAPPDAAETPEE